MKEQEYTLTKEEENTATAQALLGKIKMMQWRASQNPFIEVPAEIILTEHERELALYSANRTKATKIYFESIAKSNKERAKKSSNEVASIWDYAHFFKVMKDGAQKSGKKLIFNEQTSPLIKAICFKLSNDKRYETEMGFSFQKMLIIRGTPGLGKSFIPSLVADNPISPMQILNIHEIIDTLKETGRFDDIKWGSHVFLYLDDIGTEFKNNNKIKFMGTDINWFRTWFETFYAKSPEHLWRLIISTNDNFSEIEDKYGFRVRDRLKEADILDITGDSMRGK